MLLHDCMSASLQVTQVSGHGSISGPNEVSSINPDYFIISTIVDFVDTRYFCMIMGLYLS